MTVPRAFRVVLVDRVSSTCAPRWGAGNAGNDTPHAFPRGTREGPLGFQGHACRPRARGPPAAGRALGGDRGLLRRRAPGPSGRADDDRGAGPRTRDAIGGGHVRPAPARGAHARARTPAPHDGRAQGGPDRGNRDRRPGGPRVRRRRSRGSPPRGSCATSWWGASTRVTRRWARTSPSVTRPRGRSRPCPGWAPRSGCRPRAWRSWRWTGTACHRRRCATPSPRETSRGPPSPSVVGSSSTARWSRATDAAGDSGTPRRTCAPGRACCFRDKASTRASPSCEAVGTGPRSTWARTRPSAWSPCTSRRSSWTSRATISRGSRSRSSSGTDCAMRSATTASRSWSRRSPSTWSARGPSFPTRSSR